ncbi:MAG: class I SAM-dependent methyltransferase [Acidobacteriaceae bacterium]|nr:class I SAM-dependent methyltransferase [Acidobacteriaceae bacterium]
MSSRWQPTLEATACPACGSAHAHPLFPQDRHGLGLATHLCLRCGLLYLNPRPTASSYAQFYEHAYESYFPSRARLIAQPNLPAATAQLRLAAYRHLLPPGSRLLELGAGDGAFLRALNALPTVEAFGVEPSALCRELCLSRGGSIIAPSLEDLSPSDPPYSHAAAFHVLEHCVNPVETLRSLGARLAHGGTLLLEVPNLAGRWRGLGMLHLAHPVMFLPASLRYVVEAAGFIVVSLEEREDPLLECNLRLIARKQAGLSLVPNPAAPDRAALDSLFRQRLRWWRLERCRYQLQAWLTDRKDTYENLHHRGSRLRRHPSDQPSRHEGS